MNMEDFEGNKKAPQTDKDFSTTVWNELGADREVSPKDLLDRYRDDKLPLGDYPELQIESTSQRKLSPQEKMEKSLEDKEVKDFLDEFEKARDSGELSERFIDLAKKVGKKCLEDPYLHRALSDRLREHGVNFWADKNGVNFSKLNYLGGTDAIGHPAIPYGSEHNKMQIAYDGKISAQRDTHILGSYREPGQNADPKDVARSIFGKNEDEGRYPRQEGGKIRRRN